MNENVIITIAARRKLVRARAGAITLPKICGMAFGNGGVDIEDNVVTPGEEQLTLSNELYRKEISGYSFISDTSCRYECLLTEGEMAGEYISEIGLYDEDGDLVCIKTHMKKGKDSDLQMTFTLEDKF